MPCCFVSRLLATGLAALLLALPAAAHAQAQAKKQQFVYVLRVMPDYHDESTWKEAQNAAVQRHFERLSKATQDGTVILAGRTTEPLERTFGLVVFESENEAEARAFMEADPAVRAGIMSATLHRYAVALLRKP